MASQLVDDVVKGFNTGIFAYGQSGGGKSYSLLGREGCLMDPEFQGIIPRALDELFRRSSRRALERDQSSDPVVERVISLSMYELYLNEIYDLLLPEHSYQPNPSGQGLACAVKLEGREDRHLAKLTDQEVPDVESAIALLHRGTTRRRYSAMPLLSLIHI